eukprot:1160414-Pelagomonas_calceolata.AAC.10
MSLQLLNGLRLGLLPNGLAHYKCLLQAIILKPGQTLAQRWLTSLKPGNCMKSICNIWSVVASGRPWTNKIRLGGRFAAGPAGPRACMHAQWHTCGSVGNCHVSAFL